MIYALVNLEWADFWIIFFTFSAIQFSIRIFSCMKFWWVDLDHCLEIEFLCHWKVCKILPFARSRSSKSVKILYWKIFSKDFFSRNLQHGKQSLRTPTLCALTTAAGKHLNGREYFTFQVAWACYWYRRWKLNRKKKPEKLPRWKFKHKKDFRITHWLSSSFIDV